MSTVFQGSNAARHAQTLTGHRLAWDLELGLGLGLGARAAELLPPLDGKCQAGEEVPLNCSPGPVQE